jgi:3-deoxy-D-manno-octulosonic-acid transferase
MFFLVYNIISIFLLVPVILYHLYRSVSRGRPPAFAERFGCIPNHVLKIIAGRPVIWLHAVSVGESIAARPLLKALRAQYPGHAILVSNTTETGRGVASTFPEPDLCIYFPFDFLPAVSHVLDRIKPQIIIIMETEIWPNFTREAFGRGIPVILANGRISDRSFGRYQSFSWFFRQALQLFSTLCMQTDTDRERIIAIGAPQENTIRSGNLKYDIPFRPIPEDEKVALRCRYRIPAGMTVFTAGSTHPGEEELVLNAYRELLSNNVNLILVLVPRHPERADAVARMVESGGFAYRRRTQLADDGPDLFQGGAVLLVDTVGELMELYALSDAVFVGGSLVPTGGHNLLEPASVGVAMVFGPHMTNFREIAGLVLQYGAGIQVETAAGFVESCRALLTSPELRHVLGQNGLKLMRDNGGATERHMDVIGRYL